MRCGPDRFSLDGGLPIFNIRVSNGIAVPCITTDVGSIGEAAVDGRTALVAAPRDAGALRRALEHLIEAPDLRERLGAAARSWCAGHFGFEAMLDAMEGVFARVAASRGAGAA